MEHSPDDAPPLVSAPRHLRRRPFHAEIPDELLVPDAEPFAVARDLDSTARRALRTPDSAESVYRRKRLTALLLVIAVSLSIPALVAALILAR